MDEIKKSSLKLLLENRRKYRNLQYTVPSPDSYPYQWLWDSCFHSIILTHFNLTDAKKELLSLVSKQFPNGMIPHMIYWQKGDVINIAWGKQKTSTLTQPPMLSYAVWQIYQKDQDLEFLKLIYPSLEKFYKYLLSDRDPRNHHLVGIINPDESGEDNSPRFDIPLKLEPEHTIEQNYNQRLKLVEKNKICKFDAPNCMKNFFWVKDVPFNAIMVENLFLLSNIANVLGHKDDAKFFSEQRSLMIEAMKLLMLEKGVFWSTYGKDYTKIKVLTWAIFAPLFAKIYSKQEAEELVKKHLLNKDEFDLPFNVPTVAKSDPSFDPKGFWRGPVWISTNWFVYKGLKNYGFDKEAQKILDASLDLIHLSGFREQYDPLTGAGQGAKNFTWGTLVVDMLES